MTERWVSTPKFFCKFCKIYVTDNRISRQSHEIGLKHKGNVERFMRQARKDEDIKAREAQQAHDLLRKIDRMAGAQYIKDTGITPQPNSSTANISAPSIPMLKPRSMTDSGRASMGIPTKKKDPVYVHRPPTVPASSTPSLSSSSSSSRPLAQPTSSSSHFTYTPPAVLSASTGLGEWSTVDASESVIPASRSPSDAGSDVDDKDGSLTGRRSDEKAPLVDEKKFGGGISVQRPAPMPSAVAAAYLENDDAAKDEEDLAGFRLREKVVRVELDGDDGAEEDGKAAAPVFKKRKRRL
ncbi:hypothetical protein HK405_008343 [Cladochytrium tenue]|nr:hypothetical protein HK405_008343 [Cladochytrium tenue]